jgi:hypothetical protein
MSSIGPVLLLISGLLALGMAIQQFNEKEKLKTWAFAIHRSVSRGTVLWSKITTSVLMLIAGPGVVWTILYLAAIEPGVFLYQPSVRTFIAGWLFILLTFVIYLGAALVNVSEKRGYVTKVYGSIITIIIPIFFFLLSNIVYSFLITTVGVAILLLHIFETFQNREF